LAGLALVWPAVHAQGPASALAPLSAGAGEQPAPGWRVVGIPGGKIALTSFSMVELDSARVLRVEASKSYGNLVHAVPPAVPAPGLRLRWRWRLEQPLPDANLRRKEADDSPIKVCALFDQPLERLGLLDRSLLRLARSLSQESLPSATLCYVWDASIASGTILSNAYTGRVRLMVLDSGSQQLGQWRVHNRDLAADFKRAFADEGAVVPPLTAVLIGADADSTGGNSLAYVSDLSLAP
jgi:hypothetical protein